MENYGWSIELNPGYVLIIGNAPDAHIQLDSAYGRAVRVAVCLSMWQENIWILKRRRL